MSIFFGLLFARRFYCRSALSLSPGRTGGLFPRINAPNKTPPNRNSARRWCLLYIQLFINTFRRPGLPLLRQQLRQPADRACRQRVTRL